MSKWSISTAEEEDLQEASWINRAAFIDSEINKYIRPVHRRLKDASPEELAVNVGNRLRGHLTSPQMRVLTAKDGPQGQLVGMAVWLKPMAEGEKKPDLANVPNPNPNVKSNVDVELDPEAYQRFRDALAEKAKQTMGDRRYWNLVAIATHKGFLKRGVATALLDWGIDKAEKDKLPIMLEAVPEVAPVYAKSGFHEIDRFALDYAVKDSQGNGTGETDTIHLSIMLREPSS